MFFTHLKKKNLRNNFSKEKNFFKELFCFIKFSTMLELKSIFSYNCFDSFLEVKNQFNNGYLSLVQNCLNIVLFNILRIVCC